MARNKSERVKVNVIIMYFCTVTCINFISTENLMDEGIQNITIL